MTKWLLIFIMLVSASPALSEKSSELVVVGVYRPLELTGRRIHVERTVYLRVGEFEKVPSIAVGTIMGIYRAPGRSIEILPKNGAVDSLPQDPFLQSRDRVQEAAEPALGLQPTPLQQVLRSELSPAAPLERTESGHPAGFGQMPGDSTDDERQVEGKDRAW